ncbi:hypothetical protein FA15DRAFT_718919 [Coprinopsis marcescibilis]|uniref:Family A G protein-coupled receptor-like protein n=1 Tax=Coprinopsis marcescibilis TaxID=230819 RepID=A0A5C3L4V7_COPMA|nr:hypothetical protein FA15DRAFT_718919 [Coprinopsis marcescibilis]
MLDQRELVRALKFRLSPVFDAWIYFNLVGSNVLLPILIATFLFAKKVRRHGVLINLCIHFMVAGIFSLIQFYAGQHKLKTVDEGVCIAQAVLLSGMQPMCLLGVAMVLFYIVDSSLSGRQYSNWKHFILLGSPYIVGCTFIITTYVLVITELSATDGSAKSSVVRFGIFDCTLRGAVSESRVVHPEAKQFPSPHSSAAEPSWCWKQLQNRPSVIDLKLIIRIILFASIFVGFCTTRALLFFAFDSIPLYLHASIVPTVVFLIFGSQPDVLRTWLWMKEPTKVETPRFSRISTSWRTARTALWPSQSPAAENSDPRGDQMPNQDLNPPSAAGQAQRS